MAMTYTQSEDRLITDVQTGHNRRDAHFEDPLKLVPKAVSKLFTLWLRATYPFASIGSDLRIHYTVLLSKAMAHRIKLGSSVRMDKDVWLNIIPEATGETNIVIDDRCRLGAWSLLSAKNVIHLERDVCLAPGVLIMDHGHFYEWTHLPIKKQKPTEGGTIVVGQRCRIGQGAAIVCSGKELVLGESCIVAPNSVLTRGAPPNSLIAGNPARIIGTLDPLQTDVPARSQHAAMMQTEEKLRRATERILIPSA
jgi:acetyltransferase-like isoleucine patch superfamily enzyme